VMSTNLAKTCSFLNILTNNIFPHVYS